MDEIERKRLIRELNDLHKGLISFERRKERRKTTTYTESQIKSLDSFRRRLKQKYRWNKDTIARYGGDILIKVLGQEWDVFNYSLSLNMNPDRFIAINKAIEILETTIKELESFIVPISDWQDIKVTEQPKEQSKTKVEQMVPTIAPIQLFDAMQFHPRIIEASKSLFIDKHYSIAIEKAVISLILFIKEKTGFPKDKSTGRELDCRKLMTKVFNENDPIIALNKLKRDIDKDEQEGFRFLYMGASIGIRNPKVHSLAKLDDPYKTLQYLSLISILIKRAEEGELIKTRSPRKKWDEISLFDDVRKNCSHEIVDVITELYRFSTINADKLYWGTGATYGSFTFHKLKDKTKISVFSVFSTGSICFNFGYIKDKVDENILKSFRAKLNEIAGIRIDKDAITAYRWPEFNLSALKEPKTIKTLQDAVLSLCKQIDNVKEQT
ncbi:TIGR02391 family protein [Chloroflexota bacterium]